jgi:hypothetical protein
VGTEHHQDLETSDTGMKAKGEKVESLVSTSQTLEEVSMEV